MADERGQQASEEGTEGIRRISREPPSRRREGHELNRGGSDPVSRQTGPGTDGSGVRNDQGGPAGSVVMPAGTPAHYTPPEPGDATERIATPQDEEHQESER